MTSNEFKGFPSLQEVACSGETLKPEMKLISLQIHRLVDSTAIASLNVHTHNCITLGDFSSCAMDTADANRSRLKILVDDLEEGESREYGCVVTAVSTFGNAEVMNWKILVSRRRKRFVDCSFRHLNIFCRPVFIYMFNLLYVVCGVIDVPFLLMIVLELSCACLFAYSVLLPGLLPDQNDYGDKYCHGLLFSNTSR